jgi:arginyl-tRNA synthetase
MDTITSLIQKTIKDIFDLDETPLVTVPDEKFGDFASNIAMHIAPSLGNPPAGGPREIAEQIAEKLRETEDIMEVSVAGPGFINIKMSDDFLMDALNNTPAQTWAGKVVVCEYSDPNPFKVLHAGHLYTSIVGHTIANLFENAGAQVHRVNFGGDVGLHVGKTMWAILQDLGGEDLTKLSSIAKDDRSEWMASCYVKGTQAYEENKQANQEIISLNKKVYEIVNTNDRDSAFAQIYWTTRQWSYDYFDNFYARIGTPFEKYYPESSVAELGLKTVKEQLKNGVYTESDGAVVFEGEKFGLHTRVFINSEGLPTYEAKDVGLIFTKNADYNFDHSVVITGNEQLQYMSVVLKSVEQFAPELVIATIHLTHGIVKLAGGVKMSSRLGNFLRATDVLDSAKQANLEATGKDDEPTSLGAIKYSFLKNRMGGDIIYDPLESVSIHGNSGPYLQYAHARAKSILVKGEERREKREVDALEAGERTLVRKLGEYTDVVNKAVVELAPHVVCTYLYELAQEFNRFYEQNRVVGDAREQIRLNLVSAYADTLKKGLNLLGIHAPEKM